MAEQLLIPVFYILFIYSNQLFPSFNYSLVPVCAVAAVYYDFASGYVNLNACIPHSLSLCVSLRRKGHHL